jgi:hypothetical protein
MLNTKVPVREIAAEIGRHVSTVYRDIKRNGYTDEELPELNGYYGVVAQRTATLEGPIHVRTSFVTYSCLSWRSFTFIGKIRSGFRNRQLPTFSISSGGTTTFTDTTPGSGLVIDFATLDNSFRLQINGVDLFVGGPAGAPNELGPVDIQDSHCAWFLIQTSKMEVW